MRFVDDEPSIRPSPHSFIRRWWSCCNRTTHYYYCVWINITSTLESGRCRSPQWLDAMGSRVQSAGLWMRWAVVGRPDRLSGNAQNRSIISWHSFTVLFVERVCAAYANKLHSLRLHLLLLLLLLPHSPPPTACI